MLPSVKERKKSMHNFSDYYSNLCEIQNSPPIPGIKINLSKNVLDFVGDRIKLNDWRPILKALSCDRSLHYVAVRSKQAKKNVLDNIDSEEKARQVTKSPVLFTEFILTSLIESISKCLINSSCLTCLQLERIPLDNNLLTLLMEGFHQSDSLQHLSLKHCRIRDEGCNILCRILRYRCKLCSLDLSGCELSELGASYISETIKVQKLNHYGESWKQSLRYRPVNPEVMPGLRRITLNNNPLLGDEGLIFILDSLVDDLWIKAIDFQNCGITSFGAEHVLGLLKENRCLSVVDIRVNDNVMPAMVTEIMTVLAENSADDIPQFHWLQEETGSCRTTSSNSGLYNQYSQTTMYTTGINNRPMTTNSGVRMPNPSVRHSKSLPAKRSNITIGSSIIPGCPVRRRYVASAVPKSRIQPVIKHMSTNFKENEKQRELDSLRCQLVEETTQRIAAEEKLKELQQFHKNADDYIFIEKSIMKKVAEICKNFMAMSIANNHPHSRYFDVALNLSKLMNNPKLDGDMIGELLNKIEENNQNRENVTDVNCKRSQKEDYFSDSSANLETLGSHSSYGANSTNSFDDHSSQEDKSSSISDTAESTDSKAKLIFQSILSARRSQSGIICPKRRLLQT